MVIWSSTWVAIKIGLEDVPPLLGAGVRFALAGAGLLGLALVLGRRLRTDWLLAALLGLLPFAGAYGLDWARLVAGIAVAVGGLALAFGESLALGHAVATGLLIAQRPRRRAVVAA